MQVSPAADRFRLVPASGAEDLEARIAEPLLRRRALERAESLFAFEAPGIGPREIRVVAQKTRVAALRAAK